MGAFIGRLLTFVARILSQKCRTMEIKGGGNAY